MRTAKGMAASTPHSARSSDIALGIRATRVLALVRHAADGRVLAATDRSEVLALADALNSAAAAVDSTPTATRTGGRRNIASLGLALSTAVRDKPNIDRASASDVLAELSTDLEAVSGGAVPTSLDRLVAFLGALIDAAHQAAARPGETLVAATK